MEDSDSPYNSYLKTIFKTMAEFIFDTKLGIVPGGWLTSRKIKNDEGEESAKEEFISILEEDEQMKSIVNEFERSAITNILRLDEVRAKDVMIPRTSAFAVDINDEITEILDKIIEERYSRVPVYDKDIDNIIGVIHVKDLFAQVRKGTLEQVNLRGLLREPYFVHEYKPVDKLLIEMQRDRTHMGLIIDEYGGFSGLLTIEDILEEIVGEIDDEDDEPEEEKLIRKISDTTYRVDGLVSIDELNEELDIELPTEITETVGALLLGELGKIPTSDKDKSSAIFGNIELKAVKVSDKRIMDLLLKIK
ncbi:MAG: hemolysin family protein [Peptostreptococcaceae bacterium]|nr:hemolysin family protein [Peptostreptococcaceae bacterium]